jgi:hypothetical protein
MNTSGFWLTFWLWVLGIPALVLVVCVLLAGAVQKRQRELLTTTGRGAIGRVLRIGSDSDGLGSTSHWVRVEYNYDGELVAARVPVSEREQRRYRVGQRVGLTYAPSRPKIVRLDPPEWPLPQYSRQASAR